MAYLIDAWLENGVPQLRIRDAQTGAVRLQWTREPAGDGSENECDGDRIAHGALQRLFRELVLLSCADKIAQQISPASEMCLHCTACLDETAHRTHPRSPLASALGTLPTDRYQDI